MSEYFRKYIKRDHFPRQSSTIRFRTNFTNCIQRALLKRNYKQTEQDDWDIYWCEKDFISQTLDRIRVYPNRRINHFRNFYEICRKDLLSRNLKKYKKTLEKQGNMVNAAQYNFMPLTFNVPSEYPIFYEEYKKTAKDKCIWIMKPIGKSQGKGIFLFTKISDISEWAETLTAPEPYIVQRYINEPLLIGNKKFDLRIYVLVVSHNPLTIYLYRSGFARFTHYRYEKSDINSLQSHITNVAFQKNSDNYDEQKGGKYQLDKLRLFMITKYGLPQIEQCFYNIQQLVIKSLIATSKVMVNDRRCFELYGFDVLIDDRLKPWLVEINGSPSMTPSTAIDGQLKMSLLDDTLTIVNLEGLMTGEEEQIGGFDLIYRDGKRLKFMSRNMSLLGCLNDRDQKMRKMAKATTLRLAEKHKTTLSVPPTSHHTITHSISKGKSMCPAKNGTACNTSHNITTKGRLAHSSNRSVTANTSNSNEVVKLPRVPNHSSKNIETTKKNTDNMVKVTNSRERGK